MIYSIQYSYVLIQPFQQLAFTILNKKYNATEKHNYNPLPIFVLWLTKNPV